MTITNSVSTTIEEELKNTYLSYAISTITNRAIPDGRDGLKPVHRRILYAMFKIDKENNYKKSARIVGEVIGKYHPHGDSAVYDAIVRMAQKFSLRYPLINGQGNFGSIDGDHAAAMRYTEVKMTKIAKKMLTDIKYNTVDFVKNYDNTQKIPKILPTQIPNLLINGSYGIAVGISTNIAPHNLVEIIDAAITLLKNKDTTISTLLNIIKGPDFPTGAIIIKTNSLKNIYVTGKGMFKIQAKFYIEKTIKNNKKNLIITELPYQINKAFLIKNIAELVKIKKIHNIITLRDESNKEGIRVVIELNSSKNTDLIIKELFEKTQLQTTYSVNSIVLINNKPTITDIKQLLQCFIDHRIVVITKKLIFLINKSQEKINVLIAFTIAIHHIDIFITLIKNTKTKKELQEVIKKKKFSLPDEIKLNTNNFETQEDNKTSNLIALSKKQINSILELKLTNLINIEKKKIHKQLEDSCKEITYYKNTLNSKENIINLIENELVEVKKKFGDKRRTQIIEEKENIQTFKNNNDLKIEKKILILFSDTYIKAYNIDNFQIQKKNIKNNDILLNYETTNLILSTTNCFLFIFTSTGKMYFLETNKITLYEYHNKTKTNQYINLYIKLKENEKITATLSYEKTNDKKNLIIITKFGYMKKLPIDIILNKRITKFTILKLRKNDIIIDVKTIVNDENNYIFITTNIGKTIKFNCSNIKTGIIKAIKLSLNNEFVVSLCIITNKFCNILFVTNDGYIKIIPSCKFNEVLPGRFGTNCLPINRKNFIFNTHSIPSSISEKNNLLLVTNTSNLVQILVKNIPILSSKCTRGTKLHNFKKNEIIKNTIILS